MNSAASRTILALALSICATVALPQQAGGASGTTGGSAAAMPAPGGGSAAPAPGAAGATAATAGPAPSGTAALGRSFHGVELGMDRDTVIAALKKDPIFGYRGPEDVSLLPSPNQSLIDVSGLSFVKRGFFQFYDGKLWTIILILNPDKVDHYSVYTSLASKYGEPSLLDPQEARWENESTRLALERPLTLRYMDMAVYAKLSQGSAAQASVDELDREDFLKGL